MADAAFSLTVEERQFLADLLTSVLKEKRVEEHRTRTPSYRELIVQDERLAQSILQKLDAKG